MGLLYIKGYLAGCAIIAARAVACSVSKANFRRVCDITKSIKTGVSTFSGFTTITAISGVGAFSSVLADLMTSTACLYIISAGVIIRSADSISYVEYFC